MKLFEVYKKEGGQLSVEWSIGGGGFLFAGPWNFTFSHRFKRWGHDFTGSEKEFVLRFQIALEKEERFSWVTLELLNLYEARWFYFIAKMSRTINLKIVFNLGVRLSLASRKFLTKEAMISMRRGRNVNAEVANNKGGVHAPIHRSR